MKRVTAGKPAAYVLDTSALIAYLAAESGAERVQTLRTASALPFIALTELYYTTWRRQDRELAEEIIQHVLTWKLPILFPDTRLSLTAGLLKARFGLGIADSFVAAFALDRQATLVTKDPDFNPLRPQLKLLQLSD